MTELSLAALTTAFLAGGISFLSPCVLPLVPGYLAFVGGASSGDVRAKPAVSRALLFVCGFSTVFVILGASASLLGQWLLMYKYEATLIGGAITVLFGLFTTGLVRLAAFERDIRYHRDIGGGPVASYVLGLAFGFGGSHAGQYRRRGFHRRKPIRDRVQKRERFGLCPGARPSAKPRQGDILRRLSNRLRHFASVVDQLGEDCCWSKRAVGPGRHQRDPRAMRAVAGGLPGFTSTRVE